MPSPPDVVLLSADWPSRALIRAQLIEEGFEIVATSTWTMMRRHLRPGSKPGLVIVDLQALADPDRVLQDLHVLMDPERVLVLTAIGTMTAKDVERLGFHVLPRPFTVRDLVHIAQRRLGESPGIGKRST
jgi:hypothetical protein